MRKTARRALWLGAALAVGLTAPACKSIHEPWVQEGSPLQQYRLRPPEAQAQLRHRLAYDQIDR